MDPDRTALGDGDASRQWVDDGGGAWWCWLRYGALLLPLIFLGLFYIYPMGAILDLSLRPSGDALDLSGFETIINDPYYREVIGFTVQQAIFSTLLVLICALPAAYVFVHYRFPGKGLLMSLATLPFVLPTVVVAAAFDALIGAKGVLNDLLVSVFALENAPIQLERTLWLILIAHVFYNFAIALRMIVGYWANQSAAIEEAARVLGASGWRMWVYIRWPLLRPAILAAGVLVFIFTFTSFGVILILGGVRFSTIEVAIFRQTRDFLDLPMAAALSLVQIAFMLVMMVVYTRLQRSTQVDLQSETRTVRTPRHVGQWFVVGITVGLMSLLLFAPLLALVVRSLTYNLDGLSFNYYTGLGTDTRYADPIQAVLNSLRYAGITTVLAVTLGTLTALLLGGRGRNARLAAWLDPLFMLPLATSAVTLGFGYLIAMDFTPVQVLLNVPLDLLSLTLRGDWDLRDSPIIIPILHTLVAMPFVVRSVLPALRAIPINLQESAAVLGATPWQVWRYIDLLLISRGLIVGASFAFTVSMGEFGASLFVARPDTPTMPLVIYNFIGRSGTYGEALAMSVILMAVCAISFILIEKVRTVGVGEF